MKQTYEKIILAAPKMLFLDITSECQCRCWYCYNNAGELTGCELTHNKIEKIICDFAELGGEEVRFTGGEPTLHPNLPRFIELAARLGLRIILVSNGMANDDILEYLCRSPVSAFYLSLQGDEKTHDGMRGAGSFAWCTRTAKMLINAGKKVRLSMVFHNENYECVDFVAGFAANIGASVSFNPLRPVGRATAGKMLTATEHRALVKNILRQRDKYPNIRIDTPWDFLLAPQTHNKNANEQKRIGCGNTGLNITSAGKCFTCGQLSQYPGFCVGNIRNESIKTIWRRAQKKCPLAMATPEKCLGCEYLHDSPCFGGCAVTALIVKGSMQATDPYCFV